MRDTVSTAQLVARLEALESTVADLKAENARLTATLMPPDAAAARQTVLVTSRRGMLTALLSAGAAVTALGVANRPQRVAASHEGAVLLGHNNLTNGATQISRFANVGYGMVVYAPVAGSYGLYVQGAHTGVYGLGNAYGVFATSAQVGVYGNGDFGAGVFGNSGAGIGVRGVSGAAAGVYGSSPGAQGYGVVGLGETTGFGGHFTSNQGAAVYAITFAANANYAGHFVGNVLINGSYTATGAKSAAVRKRNGAHVRMYCQEAPEPWFEDFGTAELKHGRADVPLDPEFDEVVKGDDYRVFLTEIGDCGGLYVSRKGPHRFVVQSRAGATANGSFDYRVVARRLDDVGKRLEKVDVPAIPAGKLRPPEGFQRPPEPKKPDTLH